MKYRLLLGVLLASSSISGSIIFRGKSTFIPVPSFRPTSPEIISMKSDREIFCADRRKSFDVILIGGSSANDESLGAYFMPWGSNEVIAGELGSRATKNSSVDAIANYFGVLTSSMYTVGMPSEQKLNEYTFESKIRFKPRQQYLGLCFVYHQHLSCEEDRGWWGEIIAPIRWVRTSMNLKEDILVRGGPNGNDPEVPKGFVGSMTAAFRQGKWNFGKIDKAMTKIGIADIQLKLGYTCINKESCKLYSYWGVIIPTSNKITSEFVFEPLVGNGAHPGLYSGVSAAFRIWRCGEKVIYWEGDTCGTLLLSNKQFRPIDLKDKAWSRYMWVYLDNKTTNTSPGINVFTQRFKVTPGTSRDLNIAFAYEQPCIRAEAGYHYFARQAEVVEFAKAYKPGPAIASIINDEGDFINKGISRNRATINDYLGVNNDNTIDGEQTYKVIVESDFDLESAAHPATVVHTVYAALSYHWGCCATPMFAGIGFSYDISSDNSALQQWSIWGRYGISF